MPVAHNKDFLILYGSQTGQAEAISEEIFDKACQQGFQPARFSFSEVEKKFCLEKESCVVFVCSTTGDGEPPDAALKLVRRIRKKTLKSDHLSNLAYAFLVLGDSNYTNFCACGKLIDKRLQELGATHFYETGHADDAVGLEKVVEPWIEALYPALRNHLNKTGNLSDSVVKTDVINEIIMPVKTTENIKSKEAEQLTVEEKSDAEKRLPSISLLYSSELSNQTLKIPSSSDAYLQINWLPTQKIASFPDMELPNAYTGLCTVRISNARSLTTDFVKVKHALELELDTQGAGFDYQPGDSFGIVCQNNKVEVDYLIERLNISETCDKPMDLQIIENTRKKGAKIPSHMYVPSTLRHMLTNYVDFRVVPRKGCLKMLVEYTSEDKERRRLQELCSSQGSKEYGDLVREPLIGIVEILKIFRSCQPPIERLLEYLPRLLPREYSVASSPHLHPDRLKFVFNVIELPEFEKTKRYGLCTRWLESVTKDLCETSFSKVKSLEEKLENLTIDQPKINVYLRRPTSFRFPADPTKPLIMIGPGTGVAPYIGFLEHREYLKRESPELNLGISILFYGCRYEEKDYLYRKELADFKESGVLSDLYTSFSRDEPKVPGHTRYVQENIRTLKDRLLPLIFDEEGAVYICGDAKHMGRDVTNLFIELIEQYKGIAKPDAIKIMTELREKKQFLEDVWT